jgi:hypothetical protein
MGKYSQKRKNRIHLREWNESTCDETTQVEESKVQESKIEKSKIEESELESEDMENKKLIPFRFKSMNEHCEMRMYMPGCYPKRIRDIQYDLACKAKCIKKRMENISDKQKQRLQKVLDKINSVICKKPFRFSYNKAKKNQRNLQQKEYKEFRRE